MSKQVTPTLLAVILLVAISSITLFFYENSSEVTKVEVYDKDYHTHITLPYEEVSSYDAYKDNLYMSVADKSPSGMANKVVQYDRKTKKTTTLFTSKFAQSSVQGIKANRDWVTWVDSDDFGGQKNIYVMNTKTKKIQPGTKENDTTIDNDFPVLEDNYLAWIYWDRNTEQSFVRIRDLTTKQNKKIFTLTTHTFENMSLSTQNGNLLFTDKKGDNSYCYIYNFSNDTLEEIQIPRKKIGWGEILNDHQIVYLVFPTDEYFDDNKLILYDTETKSEIEFSTEYVTNLKVDANNHIFVGSGNNKYFEKYEITNREIKKIGEIKDTNLFSMTASNGVYVLESRPIDANQTLTITTHLPE